MVSRVDIHGRLVPGAPWEGPVVSVFSRAFNILHPAGLLVGVVASPGQMSPYSILAADLFDEGAESRLSARISTGAVWRMREGELSGSGVALDLSSSLPWEGRVGSRLRGSLHEAQALAMHLQTVLAAVGAEDGLLEVVLSAPSPTIFGRRAKDILGRVTFAEIDGVRRIRGVGGLVGLGIGFTPSGDDFISGAFLAQELLDRPRVELDGDEIRSALDRTNDGGRTLLSAVLERRFPAYLLEFAAEIAEAQGATGSPSGYAGRTVLESTRSAVSHGETSGTDAVVGFTWYVDIAGRRDQSI